MAIAIDYGKCANEQKCQAMLACPMGAITRGEDGYPRINQEICTRCRKCFAYCKNRAIKEDY